MHVSWPTTNPKTQPTTQTSQFWSDACNFLASNRLELDYSALETCRNINLCRTARHTLNKLAQISDTSFWVKNLEHVSPLW